MIGELLIEAVRNLARHKLRSLLTALGIIFGIASVMSMVSAGEGARAAILAQIGELGVDNVILNTVKPPVSQKATDEKRSIRSYGLTFRDLEQIRATVPDLHCTLPVHDANRWIWLGSRRLAAKLRGVLPDYLDSLGLVPSIGRSLTAADGVARRRVCVVRAGLLRETGYLGDPLALDLKIGSEYFRVVGVLPDLQLQSTNQAVLGIDERSFEVYAPYQTVIDRFGLRSHPSAEDSNVSRVELHQIVCRVSSTDRVLEVARCLEMLLGKLHQSRDYQVTVPLELLEQMRRTQRVFNIVLPIIAGISLLVGGIGILNIMLASITERTREIGIRRAIGATRTDITLQFLVETLALALIGGIAGVGLGGISVLALEQVTDWKPVITAWAVVLSLVIACTTGVVFGIYPARRAACMNPIEALRHE